MSLADGLRGVFAKLGIQITGEEKLAQANRTVDGSVGALKILGQTLAGSALVVGMRDFVNQYSEAGSAIQDASDRLGVNTDALQELQYAFGQAGVRGEQVNAALTGLSQRMEQAHAGTGPAASAFRALGLTMTDAHGQMLPVSDMLPDIAREMGRIEDPARRVQLATQLFGGAGRRLVGVLHDGSGGLEELRGQFQELGGGMSEDGVSAADAYGDAMGRLDVSMMAMKTRIAVVLLPVLRSVSDFVTGLTATFSRFTRGTHLVEAAFAAGGIALAVRFLPAIRSGIAAFTAFTRAQALSMLGVILLALVIDDLIALFNGGHSVIGEFLDGLLGLGTAENVVTSLKESWQDLINTIREARDLMSWDPSGRTSAAGTRAAHVGGGDGRTSAAGTRAARGGAAAVPMVALSAATDSGRTSTGGRGVIPAASVSVESRTSQVNHFAIHQRPGEDAGALSRRIASTLQQQQAASADANHPVPQNSGR